MRLGSCAAHSCLRALCGVARLLLSCLRPTLRQVHVHQSLDPGYPGGIDLKCGLPQHRHPNEEELARGSSSYGTQAPHTPFLLFYQVAAGKHACELQRCINHCCPPTASFNASLVCDVNICVLLRRLRLRPYSILSLTTEGYYVTLALAVREHVRPDLYPFTVPSRFECRIGAKP